MLMTGPGADGVYYAMCCHYCMTVALLLFFQASGFHQLVSVPSTTIGTTLKIVLPLCFPSE
jgi:hypothetical protein